LEIRAELTKERQMAKAHLKRIQANTNALQRILSDLGSARELKEFLKNIRRPGWTTPAEFLYTSGILETMIDQARVLTTLRRTLQEGVAQ
jgi:hypothetical protein